MVGRLLILSLHASQFNLPVVESSPLVFFTAEVAEDAEEGKRKAALR
jgi:hypothetical protein